MEEGFDRIEAAAYAWSHTAAPMLAGHAGHGHRPHAGRLRPVHRGRICRQHLLDRRLRADRLLVRRGGLHALSRRQAAARHQAGRGRPRTRSTPRRTTARLRAARRAGRSARKFVVAGAVVAAFVRVGRRHGRGRSSSSSRPPTGPKCWSRSRCPRAPASRRPAPPSRRSRPGCSSSPRRRSSPAYIGAGRAALLPVATTRSCPTRPSPRSSS